MPTPGADVFIGLDLGTSGLKGVAIDHGGVILASARADYPTARPEPGASEQEPAHWIRALHSVVSELSASVAPTRWASIGLSAMIPTLVLADDEGTPIGPAITWEDSRAEAEGELLRDTVGPDLLYQTTGQWVDGRYLLPMAMRLTTANGRSNQATQLLGAKDWLFGWLTGSPATDPATATGSGCFDLASGTWNAQVEESAHRAVRRQLPRLAQLAESTHVQMLTRAAATSLGLPSDIPVALGAADAVAGVLGLGVEDPGDVVYLAGTSTVIIGLGTTPSIDPQHRYLLTPMAFSGYGYEMDLLATGSGLAWLAQLLAVDGGAAGVSQLARDVDPHSADVPVFLPYVAPGEQGALWDPLLTGIVEGLTMRTGPGELVRAFSNGIVLESRRCISVLDAITPRRGDIHVAGQGIDSNLLRELADSTGRVVHQCGDPAAPHSAVGAAAIGAKAVGALVAIEHRLDDGEVVHPDEAKAEAWALLASRHDQCRLRNRRSP